MIAVLDCLKELTAYRQINTSLNCLEVFAVNRLAVEKDSAEHAEQNIIVAAACHMDMEILAALHIPGRIAGNSEEHFLPTGIELAVIRDRCSEIRLLRACCIGEPSDKVKSLTHRFSNIFQLAAVLYRLRADLGTSVGVKYHLIRIELAVVLRRIGSITRDCDYLVVPTCERIRILLRRCLDRCLSVINRLSTEVKHFALKFSTVLIDKTDLVCIQLV